MIKEPMMTCPDKLSLVIWLSTRSDLPNFSHSLRKAFQTVGGNEKAESRRFSYLCIGTTKMLSVGPKWSTYTHPYIEESPCCLRPCGVLLELQTFLKTIPAIELR